QLLGLRDIYALSNHCDLQAQNRRQGQSNSAKYASEEHASGHQAPFGTTERGERECSHKQGSCAALVLDPSMSDNVSVILGAIGFDRMLIRPDVARRGPGTS
ncbi:MAG: hypothetical protein ACI89X_004906, partial [Planctomycetota bacterium]